jgi:hypothetical protein
VVHRLSRIRGFHVHATDGSIGHIDDFLADETAARICFIVVDTSNWLGGKWVAIAPSSINRIDWANQVVHLSLTRQEIRSSPSMEEANVPPYEMTPGFVIM